MKVFGTELQVHTNETFSLDFTVTNRDGSPYIISSKISNPYILLTIASNDKILDNRYIKNYWLKLSDKFPKFVNTVPVKYKGDFSTGRLPEGHDALEYLYYNDEGYYYWDEELDKFVKYEFRFVKSFSNADTSNWLPGSYKYSITVVAGRKDGVSKPVVDYDTVNILLPPTSLTVLSDIQGGVK